ncbi:MAG: histidinol phosphate phosphatase domain-containing protein [Deltaproteobacteria bacterium]|nr:histidinol phosphate phosphatase domain-containing protein [Deltaproteobacteria bacterium]
MIDLHMHSIFSDGELVPAELARRAEVAGCRAIAITDHADHSNLDFIVPRLVRACGNITRHGTITAIPGIELTHVHPADIASLAREARQLGARLIVVHGETIAEPVMPGTNRAAIEAGIDILAHPGLIHEDEVELAASKSLFLEISARKGHSLTNGHVAKLAAQYRAPLVLNTDSHGPGDLIGKERAVAVARGAGLSDEQILQMFRNSAALVQQIVQGS